MSTRRPYKSAGKDPVAIRAAIKRQRQIDARNMDFVLRRAPSMAAQRPGGWKRNTPTAMIAEKKVIDIASATYTFTLFSTPPTPVLLNGCVAGSQNFNRIGRKIEMRSLQIRGIVQAATAMTSGADQFVRMLVVYDKQSNGASPTWANVVQSQDITGTTSSKATDMVNLDNRDRFIILRDKTFIIPYQSTTATQAVAGCPTVHHVDEFLKMNMETVFNAGTAGTVGDITTGSLHVFFCNQISGGQVAFVGSFRTRFVDL